MRVGPMRIGLPGRSALPYRAAELAAAECPLAQLRLVSGRSADLAGLIRPRARHPGGCRRTSAGYSAKTCQFTDGPKGTSLRRKGKPPSGYNSLSRDVRRWWFD